jgi:hypothetical protein
MAVSPVGPVEATSAGGVEDRKSESAESPEQTESDDKAVKDRWWVDFGGKDNAKAPPVVAPAAAAPVGAKFYRAAQGFEQESARSRLTDLNLKLLVEANPDLGEWGYVQLVERPFASREAERIRETIELPPYARGAFVDSGRTVRLLVTGTPIGERILELALTREPSFDCWIQGEWVREELFKDRKRALRAFKDYIVRYLSPECIAAWEADRAGV